MIVVILFSVNIHQQIIDTVSQVTFYIIVLKSVEKLTVFKQIVVASKLLDKI